MRKFYVSRDKSEGDPTAVMVTSKPPKKTTCDSCGGPEGAFVANGGIEFGSGGEICYSGWEKLTGIKLEKGQVIQVEIRVVK